MGFPPLLNLSTKLSTAALPSQTTKTALTLEFMFQNVAYRPTVYITGIATATLAQWSQSHWEVEITIILPFDLTRYFLNFHSISSTMNAQLTVVPYIVDL